MTVGTELLAYLPSFLRCTRVRRSSLRCFFFDIRLRRFLMTEPMTPLSDCYLATYLATCLAAGLL